MATEVASRLFPYERWEAQLPELAEEYARSEPFPFIQLDNFLDEDAVARVVAEFPKPSDSEWIQYKHYNERKLGKSKREEFPPAIGEVIDELNSPEFVSFLSRLTGIEGLVPDPALDGGGMHQTETGGFLNVHADFTMHHYQTRWRRRCNLIVYLNERWEDSWKGDLELWSRDMKACAAKIKPLINRAVIFNTDETSFHGYPDPILCPPDVTRKSLALYYFTEEAEGAAVARSTNYQARPGDGYRSVLIWIDKTLVHVYSKVKTRLGLTDDFASRVLGGFKRKKR